MMKHSELSPVELRTRIDPESIPPPDLQKD